MTFLRAAWDNIYGLLVEDGQIAIGTLVAFAVAAAWSAVAGEGGRDSAGPLLFVLLMTLLLVNLLVTARRAYSKRLGRDS